MNEKEIKKIARFIIKNSKYVEEEKVCDYIRLHLAYKTAIVLYDDERVVGVCRWNIEEGGRVAHILDLIFDKEYREKKLIKAMLIKGLFMFPTVKLLRWEREGKEGINSRKRFYLVKQLLRR